MLLILTWFCDLKVTNNSLEFFRIHIWFTPLLEYIIEQYSYVNMLSIWWLPCHFFAKIKSDRIYFKKGQYIQWDHWKKSMRVSQPTKTLTVTTFTFWCIFFLTVYIFIGFYLFIDSLLCCRLSSRTSCRFVIQWEHSGWPVQWLLLPKNAQAFDWLILTLFSDSACEVNVY